MPGGSTLPPPLCWCNQHNKYASCLLLHETPALEHLYSTVHTYVSVWNAPLLAPMYAVAYNVAFIFDCNEMHYTTRCIFLYMQCTGDCAIKLCIALDYVRNASRTICTSLKSEPCNFWDCARASDYCDSSSVTMHNGNVCNCAQQSRLCNSLRLQTAFIKTLYRYRTALVTIPYTHGCTQLLGMHTAFVTAALNLWVFTGHELWSVLLIMHSMGIGGVKLTAICYSPIVWSIPVQRGTVT